MVGKRLGDDPVFLFMVVAVVLAVGCSLTLRAVVSGGPRAAHAGDLESYRIAPPRIPAGQIKAPAVLEE